MSAHPQQKWLNLIFGLEGVLGHVTSKDEAHKRGSVYPSRLNQVCHKTPTIIEQKALFGRPSVREFLGEVTELAVRMVV